MSSLRPSWIAFGWFIAAAVTALVLLALTSFGIVDEQGTGGAADVWTVGALVIGFATGGFFVGARTGAAPVLHGLGIGLFSFLVWLAANLFFGEAASLAPWTALSLPITAALLVLQTIAAIAGAYAGIRWSIGSATQPGI